MIEGTAILVESPGGTVADIGHMKVQTLEKLQNRKSELISHLQCEQGTSGTGLIGRTKLDRVLSTRPRLSMDPLSSTVNDTFVAMRTTNTLDELNTESLMGGTVKISPMSAVHTPPASTFTSSGLRGNSTTGHGARTSSSAPHQMCDGNVASTHYMYTQPANSSSQASERGQGGMLLANDVAEDGDGKDSDYISPEVLGIVKATLEDEDDFFIPFDPPLVSKFGPISRLARTKGRNTDPVQVTAEEDSLSYYFSNLGATLQECEKANISVNMMKCTPVLSVTPLERPFPTSAPVPSMYKPQMTPRPATPISLAAALQPPPAGIYSPWSGQDFWRWQIPEMVQKLEKSAIQANSTSERLALQLQAVELQISMKTGENPKPVSQLLHEASPSNGPEHRNIKECMGRLYGTGEGGVHVQTRGEFVPSDQKWK